MTGSVQSAASFSLTQAMGPSSMNRLASKPQTHSVGQAAKDFEGMFMAQMLQPMFDTVGVDPLFGGGHGEEAMRGFLVQEYGKALSKVSSFGIAEAVQNEMETTKQKQASAAETSINNGATNAVGSAIQ